MALRILLLCLLVSTPAFADPVTFTFSGAVEEYLSPGVWDVKGLPYHHGDAVSGSLSYTAGEPASVAALNFTIGNASYSTTGTAFAHLYGQEGSRLLVHGRVEELNANVFFFFLGSNAALGGCSGSLDPCFWSWTPRPLPDHLSLKEWGALPILQIRDGFNFGTHVFSTNVGNDVFLDAPLTSLTPLTQAPEPSTWVLLASGLLAIGISRARGKRRI